MRMPVIYIKRIAWPTNHRWATKWDPIQPAMQSDHCLSFILNTESTLTHCVCSPSQTQCTSKYALLLLWNLVKWAEDSNQNRNKRSQVVVIWLFRRKLCVWSFHLCRSLYRFISPQFMAMRPTATITTTKTKPPIIIIPHTAVDCECGAHSVRVDI